MATDDRPQLAGIPDLDPGQAEAVLDYLKQAPAAARPWARQQAKLIRQQQAAMADEKDAGAADEPAGATPDLALAELGEGDDARARVHTPADRPERPDQPRRRPAFLVPALAVALVAVGAVLIYRMGLPQQSEPTGQQAVPSGSMPANHPDISGQQASVDPARIAELEAALQANPDDVPAGLELGTLLFTQGQDQYAAGNKDEAAALSGRARDLWLHITQIAPDDARAWFNLGFYYYTLEPPDTAAGNAAWQQVLELAPDSDLAQIVRNHMGALASPSVQPTAGETDG